MSTLVSLAIYFFIGSVIGVVGRHLGYGMQDTLVAGIALIAGMQVVIHLWSPPPLPPEEQDEDD